MLVAAKLLAIAVACTYAITLTISWFDRHMETYGARGVLRSWLKEYLVYVRNTIWT